MQGDFSSATHQMFDLIQSHHPTAKVLVRWYLTGPWKGALDDPGNIRLQNISAPLQPPQMIGVYGTFRLNFHRFDRVELDLRGHTQPWGAALSCLRLKWADMVLI